MRAHVCGPCALLIHLCLHVLVVPSDRLTDGAQDGSTAYRDIHSNHRHLESVSYGGEGPYTDQVSTSMLPFRFHLQSALKFKMFSRLWKDRR